jgi:hypothetical protein
VDAQKACPDADPGASDKIQSAAGNAGVTAKIRLLT